MTRSVSGYSGDRRFKGISERLREDVEGGRIPGAVALVAVQGRIELLESYGVLGEEEGRLMGTDAIFWIASMTKPITTAAALILVEAGRLDLSDPVAAYLPQLKDLQVVGAGSPERQPTILDLMRHTAGFTYGSFGTSPAHLGYERAKVYDFQQTNAEMVDKFARLPLLYQPGTTFEYGMSTDVLGHVVEVCSGQALDEFMFSRLFEPLGMRDSGFCVGAAARQRVARPFGREPFGMAPPVTPVPAWFSGGGGLWSTAPDYYRFAQMLLNFGELNGRRVLKAETVRAMRTNQLPPGTRYGGYTETLGAVAPTPAMGQDFGLGLSIRMADNVNPLPGAVGDFTWPGLSGANFWCDPHNQLIAVVMMQAPSLRLDYRAHSRNLVYRDLQEAARMVAS